MLRDAVNEVGSERSVDYDGVVQRGAVVGHIDGAHLLEHAEGMALGQQLLDGALVQVASDQ